MPEIIPRSEWGSRPRPDDAIRWDPDDLLGIVVHHFAVPRSALSVRGSAGLMRGVQSAHMAGEFSDIAYNHCFDKFGQVFEGRGFNTRTGAHTPLNGTHAAICYMGDSDLDGFPEAAQDAAGWLIKQWLNRGTGMDIEPHGRISADPTGCPGNAAGTWVRSGAWRADLPQTRRVRFLLIDDGEVIDKSVRVPVSESEDRWEKFRNSDAGRRAHSRMAAEGRRGNVTFARQVSVVE